MSMVRSAYALVDGPFPEKVVSTLAKQHAQGGSQVPLTFQLSSPSFYEPSLDETLPHKIRKNLYLSVFKQRLRLGGSSEEIRSHYARHHQHVLGGSFPFEKMRGSSMDEILLGVGMVRREEITIDHLVLASTARSAHEDLSSRALIREAHLSSEHASRARLNDGLPNPLRIHIPIFLTDTRGGVWTVLYKDEGLEEKVGVLSGFGRLGMETLMEGAVWEVQKRFPADILSSSEEAPLRLKHRFSFPTSSGARFLWGVGGVYMGRDPSTLYPEFLFLLMGRVNESLTDRLEEEEHHTSLIPLTSVCETYSSSSKKNGKAVFLLARLEEVSYRLRKEAHSFTPAAHDALKHSITFLSEHPFKYYNDFDLERFKELATVLSFSSHH